MYLYSSIASSSHFDRFKSDDTITQEVSNPLYAGNDNTATKQNAQELSSAQTTTGDEWHSPGYAEIGEVANKTVVIVDERENLSLPQKRSSSPVYAEAHKDKKQEDHSFFVEERDRSQSPEYTEVENNKKDSRYTMTMKANISYNTLQISKINNITVANNHYDESGVCTSYNYSVGTSATPCYSRAMQSHSTDNDVQN